MLPDLQRGYPERRDCGSPPPLLAEKDPPEVERYQMQAREIKH